MAQEPAIAFVFFGTNARSTIAISAISGSAVLGAVVDAALRVAKARVSLLVRNKYWGTVYRHKHPRNETEEIVVELRRISDNNESSRRLIVPIVLALSVLASNDLGIARRLGEELGRALAKAVADEEERTDFPKTVPPPVIDYFGEEFKVSSAPKPALVKKLPDCAICGLTDDKYPEWPTCSHTKQERKGT